MKILKNKNRLNQFQKSVLWMLCSLGLFLTLMQFDFKTEFTPLAQAIKCSDVVENGKTAQELGLPCGEGLVAPKKDLIDSTISNETDLRVQVLKIVNYFLSFLGLLAVIGMVYSGFLMVTAAMDESQYEKGKKGISYIAIGIIVILLSYVIVNWLIGAGGLSEEAGESETDTNNVTVTDGGESTGSTNDNNYYIPDEPSGSNKTLEQISQSLNQIQEKLLDSNFDNTSADSYKIINDLAAIKEKLLGDSFKNAPKDLDEARRDLEEIQKSLDDYDLNLSGLTEAYEKYLDNPTEDNWKKVDSEYKKLLNEAMSDARDNLREMQNNLAGYDLDLGAMVTAYENYLNNPTEANWNAAYAEYKKLTEAILKMPMIKAVITANPSYGNAPLQVALDGLKSTDPDNATIPDANYFWSYIDANGREVSLERKAVVTAEFDEPGSYIVNLKIVANKTNAAGKKTVLDGHAYFKLIVYPESTKFNLKINGEDVQTFYKVDLDTAKKGLNFDLSAAEPPVGHKFVRYLWSFGDVVVDERFDGNPFLHAYGENREYTVKVSIFDDFKQEYIKRFKILVTSIVAKPMITPKDGDVLTNFKFDATQSKPSADKIVEYLWKIIDSSGKILLESNEKVFEYTFAQPGNYSTELTVVNAYGETDTVTANLKVNSRSPKAAFVWWIKDQGTPNLVDFDSMDSFDPDEELITFDWDFDGDGKYEVVGEKKSRIQYTFKEVGNYKTKLKVVDEFWNSDTMEKEIAIESILNVNFTPNKYAVSVGEEIDFKVNSPEAIAYYWDFGDGVIFQSDEAQIKHVFETTGVFNVSLKVFDQAGNSNQKTQKIYVGNSNTPIAVFDYTVDNEIRQPEKDLCGSGTEGISIYRGSRLALDASKSVNTNWKGFDLEYLWDFGDGVYGSQKAVTHYYAELTQEKCLAISLLVKDKTRNVSAQSSKLYLKVENRLPELSFLEITPEGELLTPVSFTLNALGAKDPDGKILKYKWWYYLEGDETPRGVQTTTEPSTEITVAWEGMTGQKHNYYFMVEMTDDNNGVLNSSEIFNNDVPFEIETGKNVSPIVDFTPDKTLIYVWDSISYNANATNPQGGAIPKSAYKWDFDGDGNFDDVVSWPQVSRRYNIQGEYQVRLKVEINGLSTSKVKTIHVQRLNAFPQAAFTYQVDGRMVRFNAENSRLDESSGDQQLWYFWDFNISEDADKNGVTDDDVQDTKIAPSFLYPQEGFYKVRLTVKDEGGTMDILEREIRVWDSAGNNLTTQKESLKLSSKALFSSLSLNMSNRTISKGDTVDIMAYITQANGEIYNEIVNYRIIEGSGDFLPKQVKAKNGVATSTFKATSEGFVTVEVTAPLILGGPLVEHISFNVQ